MNTYSDEWKCEMSIRMMRINLEMVRRNKPEDVLAIQNEFDMIISKGPVSDEDFIRFCRSCTESVINDGRIPFPVQILGMDDE